MSEPGRVRAGAFRQGSGSESFALTTLFALQSGRAAPPRGRPIGRVACAPGGSALRGSGR